MSSEKAIADTYKEELDIKLRELTALMNTALTDGFDTDFKIVKSGTTGRYLHQRLVLTKQF